MPGHYDQIYNYIARQLRRGSVVPVLGAGVNLCNRPEGHEWAQGVFLPDCDELARALAEGLPDMDGIGLAGVAMNIAAHEGAGSLHQQLHSIFDDEYEPTCVHRFLGRLAHHTRTTSSLGECLLVLTTNYDTLLEQAFTQADEEYEIITYMAEGPYAGRFLHGVGDRYAVIENPRKYMALTLEKKSVIAKIHGAVQRCPRRCPPIAGSREQESYVITEDHYIDYIARGGINDIFPVNLVGRLTCCNFLFLGYSLRDWNLRVLLHRLRAAQDGKTWNSWAVLREPSPLDSVAWRKRDMDLISVGLREFVGCMSTRLPELGSDMGNSGGCCSGASNHRGSPMTGPGPDDTGQPDDAGHDGDR